MNKWNWSSMRQRGLVYYGGILSLTHSDSVRFRLKLPCRNVDLRVCCPVDWKLREHSFDTKRTPSFAKISIDRESCIREGEERALLKIQPFIYLFAFWMSGSTTGQHNRVNNWAMRGCFKWRPSGWEARRGRPGMAQLSGTKWEFALNTERQLNVKTATVHGKVNKVNSPLLHFELIDRGNNLLYHSLVSPLKSWPWNRWSDEPELETGREHGARKQTNKRKKNKTTQHNSDGTQCRKYSVNTHAQASVQTYKNTQVAWQNQG